MLNRFARFSLAIAEIDRCWHKLAAEAMAQYGLNSPHAVYLTTLYNFPEGITAAKLGELCCKNKADVSRMIGILEKRVSFARRPLEAIFIVPSCCSLTKESTLQNMCKSVQLWLLNLQGPV